MSSLCSETFYTCLTSLISHLRRQQKIVAEMKSTCPTVSSTRWSSLDLVCKWLSKNGDTVINQARSIPDLSCTHVHVCSHNFIFGSLQFIPERHHVHVPVCQPTAHSERQLFNKVRARTSRPRVLPAAEVVTIAGHQRNSLVLS
jgi:hypothetical protein